MAIRLTEEQFKQRYGVEGLNKFGLQPTQATQEAPSFAQGVQGAFGQAGQRISSAFEQTKEGEIHPLSGSLQTVGAGAGLIGDILFEGLKSLTPQPVEEALEKGVKKVVSQPVVADVVGKVNQWATEHPEAAANLTSVLDIAALIPTAKGLQAGGKVVKAGVKSIGKGISPVGKGIALAGAATEKTGKKVVSTLFTPTPSQAKQVINYQAKSTMLKRLGWAAKDIEKAPITLADTIIKYNLSGVARGNIGARAKGLSSRLFENQVKPALINIKGQVKKKTIFDLMKKDIAKVKDISRRKGLLDALDAMADDYKHVSGWGYKTLDKIKSDMSKRLPSKVWKGQEIAGDMNNVRLLFSAQARKQIRSKLPKSILDIYNDYGSLVEIAERGAKALTRGFDAGILGITSEAIRVLATPITTIGGKGIKEAGTAIKKVGQFLQK